MFRKILMVVCFGLMSLNADAKVVLITGASGDIGRGIAHDALQKGHTVIVHYNKNKDKLETLAKEFPGKVFLVQADFSKPEAVAGFWENVLKINQNIDVVINSAGIEKEDKDLAAVQETMNVNYMGPYLVCEAAIQHFKDKNIKGSIINIGSRAAFRGLPEGYYTYAVSKAALTRYSYDIARDNAPQGISVFVIAPGPVDGQMFQSGSPEYQNKCLSSVQTGKAVSVSEIVAIVELMIAGKIPSATGSVFGLMGASFPH